MAGVIPFTNSKRTSRYSLRPKRKQASDSLPTSKSKKLGHYLISNRGKKTINDLPDEILLQIFSYFSLPEVDTSLGKVCRRWSRLAEEKCLRTSVEVTLSDNISRHKEDELKKCIMENENVTRIKISLKSCYLNRQECRLRESNFNKRIRFVQSFTTKTILLATNLHTVYLETYKRHLVDNRINMVSIVEHPTLREFSLIFKGPAKRQGKINHHFRFSPLHKTVDFYTIKENTAEWSNFMLYELFFHDLLAETLSVIDNLDEKSDSFWIYNNHVDVFAYRLPNLRRITASIQYKCDLESFSHLLDLDKLEFLQIEVYRSFTRRELIDAFESSNFSQLNVKVLEKLNIGEPEEVVLKNGGIVISFSEKRFVL